MNVNFFNVLLIYVVCIRLSSWMNLFCLCIWFAFAFSWNK